MSDYSSVWGLVQDWLDAQWNPPSQRKIADRLGVSSSTVSEWKFGKSSPSPEKARALAELIEVPYEAVVRAIMRDEGYLPPEAKVRAG